MGIKVKDVMINRVVTCSPLESVVDAAKKMKTEKVGCVIIVKGKAPVGIVTREDITSKVVAENKDPLKTTLKQLMSSPLITVSPDEELSEVAKKMNEHRLERLPVKYLDKLIGLISIRQVLKIAPSLLEELKARLEEVPGFEYDEQTTDGDCELCGNYSEELCNINSKWVCENCKEEASEV